LAKLLAILALGLAIRLWFATGLALGDDVFYMLQSTAHLQGRWPPEPQHWYTRLGVTLPTTGLLKLFGLHTCTFLLLPLGVGLGGMLAAYRIARDFVNRDVALRAMLFLACFPLEIIYSTHLFPDLLAGLFSTLSLWFWIRGLRDDTVRDYLLCGACFAVAYLCRETVFMLGPTYLVLWAMAGRVYRPKLAGVFLLPLLTIAGEAVLYRLTAGSALYRWHAMAAQQQDAGNLELVNKSSFGGGFWSDPLVMLFTSQNFGLYLVAAVPLAVYGIWKHPPLRRLGVWLLVSFLWLFYGTTVPWAWVPLQRDSRYGAVLVVPAVILLSHALQRFSRPWRWGLTLFLAGQGLLAASLDLGPSLRYPHQELLKSPYVNRAVLEPFEYFAARWELGFSAYPPFRCVSDQGRQPTIRLLSDLNQTEFSSLSDAEYFIFSPERRPDLGRLMRELNWRCVAEVPGRPTAPRAALARLFRHIPILQSRAERISSPPKLVVFRNPTRSFAKGSKSVP
jgi:4-amino-4-deoxy-L-arabinose transferase-like glycosyltransferase